MIDGIQRGTRHSIRPIVAVLGVPRSSYWQAAHPTATKLPDPVIDQILHSH